MSKERTKTELLASQTARDNLRETRALLRMKEPEEVKHVAPLVAVTEGVAQTAFARATAILNRAPIRRQRWKRW